MRRQIRHLVGTVSLPQALASRFTARQLKVVLIVNDECRMHGRCSLPLDAIAARAGVCRSTAQNAVREAQRLGLITLEERRPLCQPSLTNIVRIVPSRWELWPDSKEQRRMSREEKRSPVEAALVAYAL